MDKKMVRILVLINNQILLSEIEEVGADIGEPDCKLVNPYVVNVEDLTLKPYLLTLTKDDNFMMSSDKIITLVEPTPTLLEKYLDLIDE
jgi:hypothetical protein